MHIKYINLVIVNNNSGLSYLDQYDISLNSEFAIVCMRSPRQCTF